MTGAVIQSNGKPKSRRGGARPGAGRPKGGARNGGGRPPSVPDSYLRDVNMARAELRKHTLVAAKVFIAALAHGLAGDPCTDRKCVCVNVRMTAAKEVLGRAGVPMMQAIQASIETDQLPLTVVKWPRGRRPEPSGQ